MHSETILNDGKQISAKPLEPNGPGGEWFIHARIEDPEVQAQVKAFLESGKTLFIDIKDVVVQGKK